MKITLRRQQVYLPIKYQYTASISLPIQLALRSLHMNQYLAKIVSVFTYQLSYTSRLVYFSITSRLVQPFRIPLCLAHKPIPYKDSKRICQSTVSIYSINSVNLVRQWKRGNFQAYLSSWMTPRRRACTVSMAETEDEFLARLPRKQLVSWFGQSLNSFNRGYIVYVQFELLDKYLHSSKNDSFAVKRPLDTKYQGGESVIMAVE